MQRDQKIGLALGILLVGVVAAFFFRHEPAPQQPLPTLQTAEELDHRIAERDRAPYLTGEPDRSSGDDALFGPDPWDSVPGGLVPEPIPLGDDTAAYELEASIQIATEPAARQHVVQRGDTLSSIAATYLGSATRFEEIYNANADRLRSPNDLRVGMELRIPGRVPSPSQTAVTTPQDTGGPKPPQVAPRTADSSSSAGKFEPYRRSPLTPQGTDPQSTTLDPKELARRRLSQLPPRGDVSPPR